VAVTAKMGLMEEKSHFQFLTHYNRTLNSENIGENLV